jgi:hypothetical protein
MDDISILGTGNPDKKIVRLDVTIYEGFVMDRLNSRNLMQKQKLRTKYEHTRHARIDHQRT